MSTAVNPLFDALLDGRAQAHGEQASGELLTDDRGHRVDDAEFFGTASAFAAVLADAGVTPGDRVAAQLEKSWQALALYVGTVRAGAVFLPLNTAYTDSELAYFIGDAEPRVLVVDPARLDKSTALAAQQPFDTCVMSLDRQGMGTLIDRASTATPVSVVPRSPEDLAAILYTSGTTGRSKGAMLSHANLLSNAEVLVDAWAFTADDVLLHALPIFHTHGLFVACNTVFLSGARMQFLARFDPDAVIESLPEATVMMGVPTFYKRLLADARFDAAAARHMRLFVSGSAPLLAATHAEFEHRTGQRILERYGMTETNMNCSNPYRGERRAGTVGPALPGVEVRLAATGTDTSAAAGDVGMLEVRGPNVFSGYWRMPEKTREELGEDGWFITGDLATIDAEGYVTIVGRNKDLVISGGYNIYPKELEVEIDALDGVLESAVVGAPDDDLGERVIAFAVTGDQTEQALDEASLLAALAPRLARYKLPRRIHFIDELPRNAMGKVMKNVLRERALETARDATAE